MNEVLAFFNSDNFMPHGHCFLWQPNILWLHVISDAGIAFAYYLIPLLLFIFIRKRKDLPYKPLFAAFCAFILLCGTTHLLAIWVLWNPDYALEGVVKALTGLVSLSTLFILCNVVPKALRFIDPAQQESAAQFELLANLLPQLAWMADETGWIYWYNDRWYEYTGTTLKDMEGWGWQSVHDAEKLPSVMEKWQKSIATGQPFEMAFPLKGGDGSFRQFLTRVNPLHDTNGKIIKWFGTNTDITDQYQAETRAIEAFHHEETERTKLLALIDSAPDFIGMADLEGNLLYHNQAARRLVGLPDDYDVSELKISNMHPQWASERVLKDAVPVVYEKGFWKGETALLHRNGHEIPVSQTLALYRDKSGNPVCLTTIIQDISDQKNYRLALEKLHAIITKSDLLLKDKIYSLLELGRQYLKMPNGIMSHICNDIYEAKYPLVSEGIISEGMQFPLADTFCIHTFKAQAPTAFEHVGESSLREHACYKNFCMESYIGCPVFVEGIFYGAVSFSHSQPRAKAFNENEFAFLQLLAQWIGNEIDREQSDNKLKASEQSLALGWQGTGVGMWNWNVATNEIIWSDRFNILLGFAPNELPGRYESWEERLHKDDKAETVAAVAAYLSQQTPHYEKEYRLMTKSSEWRWFHATGQAIWNDKGEPLQMVGSLEDITDRKEYERKKSGFMSMAAHELRTPVTSIRGSLGLMRAGVVGELPPKAKQMTEIAYNNSERLILLINDILDMEKLEAGGMRFEMMEHDLGHVVTQAVEANKGYGDQFGVKYSIEPLMRPALVRIDSNRFIQVLSNLLSNAAKFSPVGDEVRVAVTREDKVVRVSITDKGTGIPEEFRSRIFGKFAQARTATNTKGGTGLGLNITKQIIEHMGGEIGFESEPAKDTTFWVELPEIL